MKVKQVVVSTYAALFIFFGIAALVSPILISNVINFDLQTPAAKMEFMATYGGLFLGIGFFMLHCVKSNTHLGLVCVLLTMGAMLLSRVLGAFYFGGVDIIQTIYIGGELFTTLLITFLLYKYRSAQSA